MSYVPGRVYAICDRCGFQFALSELRKEWTGLMVCKDDWDRRPAEMSPPKVTVEGAPVHNARPDNQGGNEPNITTPEDL